MKKADFFALDAPTDAAQSSYFPWINYGTTTPTITYLHRYCSLAPFSALLSKANWTIHAQTKNVSADIIVQRAKVFQKKKSR